MSAALVQAAADHQVSLVDDAQAPRFRVKGYVTAGVAPDGKTELAYVRDVRRVEPARPARHRHGGSHGRSRRPLGAARRQGSEAHCRQKHGRIRRFPRERGVVARRRGGELATPRAVPAGAVTGAAVGAGAKPLGFAASE